MRKRLLDLVPVRSGEGHVTSLMFLYIFSTLTFYYILKPMRSSFFLKNLPSTKLPFAYILTAIFAGTLTTLVFKYSRRLSVVSLLTATNLVIVGTLFYFRSVMGRPIWYLPYVWFVYLQIVSVLQVAQFWLLAGYIYDNRQAKRIYGLLGAGAIAGSIAGSFVPAFLSKTLSTDMKLLIAAGICFVLIALAQIAWRYRRPEADEPGAGRKQEESQDRLADLLRLVFGSRHLALMVLLVCLTLIASQIAEWQVNNALDRSYRDLGQDKENLIDQFWGRFYFWTNILGITLQLTVTGFVVSRLGIGAAIVFLPGGLLLASIGVFLAPSLSTTALALGSNNVFRYSINRAGFELLYLPLSPAVRKKLKLFVDVFVDRLGRAIAALVILTFNNLRSTSAAAILLTVTSVGVCLALRKAYVNAFREQLARREVDLAEIQRYVTDPQSLRLLVDALDSPHERQILYSLRLLQSARRVDGAGKLLPLLKHASPHVREQAVRTLPALPGNYGQAAEELLKDPSELVRQAAAEYICSVDPAQTADRLRGLLDHKEIDVRVAAARCVASLPSAGLQMTQDYVRGLLSVQGPAAVQARTAGAHLAALLPARESVGLLRELLGDLAPEVVAGAMRAGARAGQLDLVFDVVQKLSERRLRGDARDALLTYGQRITGSLGDILADTGHSLKLRREIPWVLARIPTLRSADILLDNLGAQDPLLRYRVVKALNRLHETKHELPPARPVIAERIYSETRAYYEALALWQPFANKRSSASARLLESALREKMDQDLEIIFRLLGLQYRQKDIYFAYSALKGSRSDRRAAAIEFLDNLLQKNLKSLILPLLEEPSAERLIDMASRIFGIPPYTREEALRKILERPDVWLKACALHEIGDERITALSDLCRTFSGATDLVVRETAEWALKRVA